MKQLLSIGLLIFSFNVFAQSDAGGNKGPHNVSAMLSFQAGGLAFGGAYEYMVKDSYGAGAHFRLYQKEDSGPNQVNGVTIIGATGSHHFYKKSWDLAFTPSFNLINIDSIRRTPDDSTTFGPGIGVSLLCQLTDNVAAGFDWSNYYVWFDKDYAGLVMTDLAAKVRFSF